MNGKSTQLGRTGAWILIGSVLIGLSLISGPAFGQDVEKVETGSEPRPTAESPEQQRPPITLSGGASYQAPTDIDKGGEFTLERFTAGIAVPVNLNEFLAWSTTLKYELANYDFAEIPDLWQDIHTFTLVSLLRLQGSEECSFYAGPIVRLSAESGAHWGNGWTGGGIVGGNYKFNEKLTLGAGVAVVSRIVDNAAILPLLTLDWKFRDDWRLKAGFVDVATTGYGLELVWDFTESVGLSFGAQYHDTRFRLDGEGASRNGVGEEKAVVLYAAAIWHATSNIDLNAFAGIVTGGNVRVENSGGHKVFDQDYDPTPVVGLRASVRL